MNRDMNYIFKRLNPHFESKIEYKYRCCFCGRIFTSKKRQKPLFEYTNLAGKKCKDYYCPKHKADLILDACLAGFCTLVFLVGMVLMVILAKPNDSLDGVHSCNCVYCEKKGTTVEK